MAARLGGAPLHDEGGSQWSDPLRDTKALFYAARTPENRVVKRTSPVGDTIVVGSPPYFAERWARDVPSNRIRRTSCSPRSGARLSRRPAVRNRGRQMTELSLDRVQILPHSRAPCSPGPVVS